MGRISRGFRLISVSWEVLRRDRELMLLPVFSFISVAVVAVPLSIGLYASGLFEPGAQPRMLHYLTIFIFYVISYFITIFFNAALVGAAMIRLTGGNPSVRDGLRMAMERIEKIFVWAIIAATVGTLLRAAEERAGAFGRILIAIVNVAWAAVTYFVVPVLIFEPLGVGASMKRSAALFRQRWGETFVGNAAIGAATALIIIPVVIAVAMVTAAQPFVGVPLGVLLLGFLFSFSAAVSGVFNAALYRYATVGEATGGFTEGDLRSAFRAGRKARGPIAAPFEPGGVFGDLDDETKARVQQRLAGESAQQPDPPTPPL